MVTIKWWWGGDLSYQFCCAKSYLSYQVVLGTYIYQLTNMIISVFDNANRRLLQPVLFTCVSKLLVSYNANRCYKRPLGCVYLFVRAAIGTQGFSYRYPTNGV